MPILSREMPCNYSHQHQNGLQLGKCANRNRLVFCNASTCPDCYGRWCEHARVGKWLRAARRECMCCSISPPPNTLLAVPLLGSYQSIVRFNVENAPSMLGNCRVAPRQPGEAGVRIAHLVCNPPDLPHTRGRQSGLKSDLHVRVFHIPVLRAACHVAAVAAAAITCRNNFGWSETLRAATVLSTRFYCSNL